MFYAKNVHEVLYPASLTKVLTALVALKNGNRDDVLTASSNVIITESGAQLCGLKPGDTMTLDQALRILLLYSANDVAIMIAEQYEVNTITVQRGVKKGLKQLNYYFSMQEKLSI